MDSFHAICAAFAGLAPFAAIQANEEPGNALPLWHGVNGGVVHALMNPDAFDQMSSTTAAHLSRIRAGMPRLAERLHLEFDQEALRREDDAFLDIKLARLTDALIGSVADWGVPARIVPLQRFNAIIEDFYVEALLKLAKAVQGDFPLTDWPVATFSDTETLGIHTISPDAMHNIAGVPIGLVSLPTGYAEFPVLWVALAHEVCGHDLVRAFDDQPFTHSRLFLQLQESFHQITNLSPGWSDVWRAWLEEAIADVYGLAIMGPTFAIGMAAWLSTTNAASAAHPPSALGELTNVIWLNHGHISEHPPNLIRLHMMLGALKAMATNSKSSVGAYIDRIAAIIAEAGRGQTSVAVIEGSQGEVAFHYDMADLVHDAETIGRHIASAKVAVLDDTSIADLMAWTQSEEAEAAEFSRHYLTGSDDLASGQPRWAHSSIAMMAGALMAIIAAPGEILTINDRLKRDLEDRGMYLVNRGNG